MAFCKVIGINVFFHNFNDFEWCKNNEKKSSSAKQETAATVIYDEKITKSANIDEIFISVKN